LLKRKEALHPFVGEIAGQALATHRGEFCVVAIERRFGRLEREGTLPR
jgi:hypothetical protein